MYLQQRQKPKAYASALPLRNFYETTLSLHCTILLFERNTLASLQLKINQCFRAGERNPVAAR